MKVKNNKKNIAVIFGGVNCEHDISIITAMQTIANLDKEKYSVYPIYINKNGEWFAVASDVQFDSFVNSSKKYHKVMLNADSCIYVLRGKKYVPSVHMDCAVVCMHGMNGEDGSVMGLLNMCKIPYACSDILPSAIGCDKTIFKYVCAGLSIPIIDFVVVRDRLLKENCESVNYATVSKKLGDKLIVKPSRLGSSIGIRVVNNEAEYNSAIEYALTFDSVVIVERYIEDMIEINVAIMRDQNDNIIVSNLEEPVTMGDILSFDEKYLNNGKEGFAGISKIVNPKIKKVVSRKIIKYAQTLYENLDMYGIVRFDFIVSNDIIYINEVNTIPGSMAYYLIDSMPFSEQLDVQIDAGINRYQNAIKKRVTFDTNVLSKTCIGCKK